VWKIHSSISLIFKEVSLDQKVRNLASIWHKAHGLFKGGEISLADMFRD